MQNSYCILFDQFVKPFKGLL